MMGEAAGLVFVPILLAALIIGIALVPVRIRHLKQQGKWGKR